MEVEYLKTLAKYTLVLILAMFLRTAMNIGISDDGAVIFGKNLNYEEVEVVSDSVTYKKPVFNDEELNNIIDKYIETNSCTIFNYNIYRIGSDKVNVYMDCGKPNNVLYNYKNNKMLTFDELIKDKDTFISSVKRLLNLKYPTFVTEEVDVLNGIYDVRDKELVGYYETEDYGNLSIKINNNEIKNTLDFSCLYDENYENETYIIDKTKKSVAFTFDDGPSDFDLQIIDALVNSHSKATFFVVGNRIENFANSISKMLETNMEVGNHSYDHRYLVKLKKEGVLDEINHTNEIYQNLTGNELKIFRPPYGSIKSSHLKEANIPSILWSLDTLDWKSRDTDAVYNEIMNNIKDGDIILMHSLYETTRDAVIKVIPELYKQGYQIVTVSELANIKGYEITPGESYTSLR